MGWVLGIGNLGTWRGALYSRHCNCVLLQSLVSGSGCGCGRHKINLYLRYATVVGEMGYYLPDWNWDSGFGSWVRNPEAGYTSLRLSGIAPGGFYIPWFYSRVLPNTRIPGFSFTSQYPKASFSRNCWENQCRTSMLRFVCMRGMRIHTGLYVFACSSI